jgi:hypothetical protein
MPIKIKSASGSVTLSSENVSGDQTLTVPSQASATLQTTADTITSSRLTGALPAISGASLTSLTSGNLSGALPAISGASLTNLPAGGVAGITSASSSGTAINIGSGNKVGIGSSAPTEILHVTGTTDPKIKLQNTTSGESTCTIVAGGNVTIQSDKGLDLQTGSTPASRIFILPAGNVGIGTGSPGQALDVAGEIRTSNGILFGTDTASANRMDDYEEGTWTPGFMLGSPTYTTTWGSRGGVYCKIGNMIHVLAEIYMGTMSFGDGSQIMRIGPLPYYTNPSIGTSFGLGHSSCIRIHNWYTDGSSYNNAGVSYGSMIGIYPKVITNSNYIEIHISIGNNHGGAAFKNAAFHAGSGMSLGLTYRT